MIQLLMTIRDADGKEWLMGAVTDGTLHSAGCGTEETDTLKPGDFDITSIKVVMDAPDFN